ncbi:MAG: hypothetical protein ED859_16020 [Desulfuromonadales bacterium]|nr:MAG: hypothetical protein ED859_16020 [Desulfuromonadales bacterium]
MTNDERDQRLMGAVKEHLDARVESLDDRTVARLRQARLDALEAAERKRGWLRVPRWVTVGGLATAVAAVVAVSLWITDYRRQSAVATMDDIEIVAAQEQVQLYEDLEFYRWLADRENGN